MFDNIPLVSWTFLNQCLEILIGTVLISACLADEEMTLEEDSIEESRRRAEDDQRKALMEVQRREEEKRAKEEKM